MSSGENSAGRSKTREQEGDNDENVWTRIDQVLG